MNNRTSQHILNTAANLLGFCLFVITSFHLTNLSASTFIDEFTASIALLLAISCIFSFISMRSNLAGRIRLFEAIAEYIFLLALIGILMIIILIIFKFLA